MCCAEVVAAYAVSYVTVNSVPSRGSSLSPKTRTLVPGGKRMANISSGRRPSIETTWNVERLKTGCCLGAGSACDRVTLVVRGTLLCLAAGVAFSVSPILIQVAYAQALP